MTDDVAAEPFGPVEIEYALDAATYERVREAYRQDGSRDDFAVFVQNHCEIASETVTVDGEPVDPDADDGA